MTNYEQFQIERYGNILPEPVIMPDGELLENGKDEMERFAEWNALHEELQLFNDQQ